MKKALKLISLVAILALPLMACSGSDGVTQSSDPNKVGENSNNGDSQETASTPSVFKIGEEIQLGDYIVSVASISDPYVENNQFSQPDSGNKYIAIEVTYKNPTSDKTIDYNPFDWTLYDSNGYNYDQSFMASKDPDLSSGTLNPGRNVRGWITFEVPSDSSNYTVQFTPNWLFNDNVEVELF